MKLCIFIFLFISNSLFPQTPLLSGNITLKPEKFSSEFIEKSKQNIYYKTTFINNTDFTSKPIETITVLQIGNNSSKFFDLNLIKKDSIIEQNSKLDVVGTKEINQLMNYRELWECIVLKKSNNNSIIIQTRAKHRYQYQENQPIFDWKLQDGSKNILDYTCFKATLNYRGRKYIAWYAKDLPLNNGPFLFQGLPGLILEIEDEEKHFYFSAIAMDKKENNIYLRNEEKIFLVSREKYRIIEKSYHDNPSFFMKKAYNEDGSLLNDKIKKIPYNPIELE